SPPPSPGPRPGPGIKAAAPASPSAPPNARRRARRVQPDFAKTDDFANTEAKTDMVDPSNAPASPPTHTVLLSPRMIRKPPIMLGIGALLRRGPPAPIHTRVRPRRQRWRRRPR